MMEFGPFAKRTVYQLICILFFFSVSLWFSILLYSIIYYLYIPAVAHTRPIYLQYPISCWERNTNTDKLCPFPSANVSLLTKGDYTLLRQGQGYAVEVALEIPESVTNSNIGMFMVKLDMLSQTGEILKSSSRPVLLPYKSWLFQVIYTLFFTPSLLVGTMEEKQDIVVQLFENYQEDSYHPTAAIYIEVLARNIEIYSSKLRIHARFTGLRYYMYYWPLSCAVMGVSSTCSFISIFTILIWLRYSGGKTLEVESPLLISRRAANSSNRKLPKGRRRVALKTRRLHASQRNQLTDEQSSVSKERSSVGIGPLNTREKSEGRKKVFLWTTKYDQPPRKHSIDESSCSSGQTEDTNAHMIDSSNNVHQSPLKSDEDGDDVWLDVKGCDPDDGDDKFVAGLRKRKL